MAGEAVIRIEHPFLELHTMSFEFCNERRVRHLERRQRVTLRSNQHHRS